MDSPVYDNNENDDELEHNLENPLYGDTNFLASPVVTRNQFFQFDTNEILHTTNQSALRPSLNRNDYETIQDQIVTQDPPSSSSQPERRSRLAKVKIPVLKKEPQVYDKLLKKSVRRRSSGDYSSLDTSQHDYATLEPYTSSSIHDNHSTGSGGMDDEDYSRLSH